MIEKLQQLQDNEINFKIECFFDAGFDWYLGDETNGFISSGNKHKLEDAITELLNHAKMHYNY